jgi:type II secretory pathway pseudopilin PulG
VRLHASFAASDAGLKTLRRGAILIACVNKLYPTHRKMLMFNSFRMKYTTRSCHRFSLMEIMVVLVIAGIMLTLTFPVFEKLLFGSNVDSGSRQVASQLRLARQYAITNRKRVAILMPQVDFDSGGTVEGSIRYRASALRTCIVSSTGEFQQYVSGTKWTLLPQGVYFTIDDNLNAGDGDDAYSTTVSNVAFPEDGSSDIFDVRAITFLPSGSVVGSTTIGYIEIEEMILAGSTLQVKQGGANKVAYKLNWLTGRVEE